MTDFYNNIDALNSNIRIIVDNMYYVINILYKYHILSKNIITKLDSENIDYYIFKNIEEIINYKNIINEDIRRINNEQNLFKKFSNIMNIYNKMNNIFDNNYIFDKKIDDKNSFDKFDDKKYEDKINYKFIKEPQNLEYKLDITNSNDFYGVNDLFEIFISYKDNKEYIVSKNINDYNLDIFTLLDNKKILTLKGHTNHITTIRYFIKIKNIMNI